MGAQKKIRDSTALAAVGRRARPVPAPPVARLDDGVAEPGGVHAQIGRLLEVHFRELVSTPLPDDLWHLVVRLAEREAELERR